MLRVAARFRKFRGMGRWVYEPWFWPPTNNIAFKEVPNPYYDCDPFGMPILRPTISTTGVIQLVVQLAQAII